MLQNTRSQAQTIPNQALYGAGFEGADQGLDLRRYFAVLKRRKALLILPFFAFRGVGSVITMLVPAQFRWEAKILVEPQQIRTELGRPRVTATAKERIQVIEQRV